MLTEYNKNGTLLTRIASRLINIILLNFTMHTPCNGQIIPPETLNSPQWLTDATGIKMGAVET